MTQSEAEVVLAKQIEQLSLWQFMCWIPLIVPTFTSLRSGPIPPDRVIYVLIFRVAMLLLGVGASIWIAVKKKRLRAQLAALLASSATPSGEPPVPLP